MKHIIVTACLLIFSTLIFDGYQLVAQDLATLINDQGSKVLKMEEGLALSIHNQGKGLAAKTGDYLVVEYEGKLLEGKVFDKSEAGQPIVFQLGKNQVIPGWESGFTKLKKGSTATLYVPSSLGYGPRGVGAAIPPNSDLVFDIQLLDILDQAGYDQYMDQEEERAKKAFKIKQRRQHQSELQAIRTYIKQEKISAKSLQSGLSVVVKKRGKKTLASPGKEIAVTYTGYLLDGSVFDKTEPGQPFRFTMGENKVIPGWEEGLQYFGRGGQGKLIIPSQLAYGPRPITEGEITIPSNSTLIFDIKVVELQK